MRNFDHFASFRCDLRIPITIPTSRQIFLSGLAIAVTGVILFSVKAIVTKLIYRYPVDAVLLITFRMLFSLPVFAAVALWKARNEAPLSNADGDGSWCWD